MALKFHGNFNLLLMGILILPSKISPLPAAQISVLPTEIFTFPKCYSQIPLASSFSAQKFCKFMEMAAFAKSKVKITMSKIENQSTCYLSAFLESKCLQTFMLLVI